jgi:putative membrane protein
MTTDRTLHIGLLTIVLAVLAWSAIGPYDYPTWVMETAPVLIVLPLLGWTYSSFRLTNLLYVLIAIHAIILIVGAHYTYARVPAFNWLRDVMGAERNSYDGLGHLAQGFIPAIAARELLLRTSPLHPGKWLTTLIVLGCLGISAIYELLEWGAAVAAGGGAVEFLGTQGDVWDTQKDMALCGIGAICALVLMSRLHDKGLKHLGFSAKL